ncbi:hypothetical protein BWD42_07240 [Sphingobacterium sp. CZ-UAM]|uniref:hypothetical protein n=1 Tax=Sphingobacterium sp. CZ-UAM TaxID=1933868 RepID=UPI0009841F9F|nr:hypothetical protein [Sphingobacterium sp. CZ-UAM]OOG19692.1 hypothetical protein BWD42_07240 [Sphingobacterium sp. CZ-UAM]
MKKKNRTKYVPPYVFLMMLELEQSFAAESATTRPVSPTDSSNQPEVTEWKTGGDFKQSFEL